MPLISALSQEPRKSWNRIPAAPTNCFTEPPLASCSRGGHVLSLIQFTAAGNFRAAPTSRVLNPPSPGGAAARTPLRGSQSPALPPASAAAAGCNQLGSPLSYFLAGRNFPLRQQKTTTAALRRGDFRVEQFPMLWGPSSQGGVVPPRGVVAWGWIFPTLLKFPPPLELGVGLGHVDLCPPGSLQCLILQLGPQHSKGEMLIITSGFWGETDPKKAKPD